MLTENMVEIAKKCYNDCNGNCPGDSGEVKCFFCAGCVLSLNERAGNLEMWIRGMIVNHMQKLKVSDKTKEIISRLERSFTRQVKGQDYSDHKDCTAFQHRHDMKGYEIWFQPEVMNYESCLTQLHPEDVVFDVGAGDLRFDLIMAEKVKKVYAVEINPSLLGSVLRIIGWDLPTNLTVICGNAVKMDLPSDVTTVTCLMIMREHEFPESWKKCRIISYGPGIREMNVNHR